MDFHSLGETLFRWIHVVAGVLWIGLLYFFNWVNGPFAKTLDADCKRKVLPELLPRTLYFFRWGAAYTWVSGILLLFLVFYIPDNMLVLDSANKWPIALTCLAIAILGAGVYDLLWKSPLAANQSVGVVVSFVLLVALVIGLKSGLHLEGRALFIHVGALFGTAMALNVWMRIWPAQRKIIAAVKAGEAPPAGLPALAGLRSKHNTYLSVPLILLMLNTHASALVGHELNWLMLALVVVVGWVVTFLLYRKAGGPAPTAY